MPGTTGGPTVLFGLHYVWLYDRTARRWELVRDPEADERAARIAAARADLLASLQRGADLLRGRRDERPAPDTRPTQPDPEPVTVDPEPVPA